MTGKRILAVDNHPVILKFLSSFLTKQGHTVLTAEDSLSALDLLESFVPDVMFIDLVMPNINGRKLCRMVRNMEKLKDTYIVILSAIAAEEEVDFVSFGADAYIAKGPFEKMAEHIHQALRESEAKPGARARGLCMGSDDLYPRQITTELLSLQRHFEAVLGSMAEGIVELSQDWRVVYANASALSLLGRPEERILGQSFASLFEGEDARRVEELKGADPARSRETSEERPVIVGGRQILIDVVAPKSDEFRIAILNDVTEKKRLESQIRQSQKMGAIATLTGGIAHDFNNLLAAILGNISLAKLDLKPGDRAYRRLEEGEKATLGARDLTQQLLTFSKGGSPVRRVFSLLSTLRGELCRELANPKIKCSFSVAEDLLPVHADENQIAHVMSNLIVNAEESMPEGGTVSVSAENVVVEERNMLPVRPGRYVRISVSDSGVGIPSDQLSIIFDPYYSTKETWNKKGLGLGLAVCHSIITRHGGAITVDSVVGKGSTFLVYLPAADAEPGEETVRPAVQSERRKRILLMDDEKAVRDIGGEILSYLGYDVEFAGNGDEALRLFREAREHGTSFDGVILDLVVDGNVVGDKVMRALRDMDREVKGIVSSGYSNDPIMSGYQSYGFSGVIAKPYRIQELDDVLKGVIG